jgi:hypothetical protein
LPQLFGLLRPEIVGPRHSARTPAAFMTAAHLSRSAPRKAELLWRGDLGINGLVAFAGIVPGGIPGAPRGDGCARDQPRAAEPSPHRSSCLGKWHSPEECVASGERWRVTTREPRPESVGALSFLGGIDRATVHPPGYMDKPPVTNCTSYQIGCSNPTHAPSSLQNIRPSSDVICLALRATPWPT